MFPHRKHGLYSESEGYSQRTLGITATTSFSSEMAYSSQFPKSTKRTDSFVSTTRGRSTGWTAYRNNQAPARGQRSSASRSTCSQKYPAAAPGPFGVRRRRPLSFRPAARRKHLLEFQD